MKKSSNTILKFLLLSLIFLSCVKNKNFYKIENVKIVETSTSKEIDFYDFSQKILVYDIILFGEKHDDEFTHKLESITFESMFKNNKKIALSLEMFEKDVQNILDSYLKNEITESEFLQSSRPWPNYQTDYKPLIEFARENKIPVIASNIPRKFASIISKSGKDSLYKTENIKDLFFEPVVDLQSYKERFFEFMSSIMPTSPMGNLNKENTYISQLFKDATMAGSIKNFLNANKDYKILHICGEFHSNYHLGIYSQLEKMLPDRKIVTIAIVDSTDFDPQLADFIFVK